MSTSAVIFPSPAAVMTISRPLNWYQRLLSICVWWNYVIRLWRWLKRKHRSWKHYKMALNEYKIQFCCTDRIRDMPIICSSILYNLMWLTATWIVNLMEHHVVNQAMKIHIQELKMIHKKQVNIFAKNTKKRHKHVTALSITLERLHAMMPPIMKWCIMHAVGSLLLQ